MKTWPYLILCLILVPVLGLGQQLQGTLLDSLTRLPIEGAHIYYQNQKLGTYSKSDGSFSLRLLTDADSLYLSHIGYKTKIVSIYALQANKAHVLVLTPLEDTLDEVAVSSKKKPLRVIKASRLARMKSPVCGFGSLILDDALYISGGDLSTNERRLLDEISRNAANQKEEPKATIKSNFKWSAYSGKLQRYHFETNSWSVVNTNFIKRAYHDIYYRQGKLYVIGGKSISPNGLFEYLVPEIEIYDMDSATILSDPVNPHQAANLSVIPYQGNLLTLGGTTKMDKNNQKEYLDQIQLFDVHSGNWYPLTGIPFSFDSSSCAWGNSLYLLGETEQDSTPIYVFNLDTARWSTLTNIPYKTNHQATINAYDGLLYIYQKHMFTLIDLEAGTLKQYRTDLSITAPKLHFYEGQLIAVGGQEVTYFSATPNPYLYSILLTDFKKAQPIHLRQIREDDKAQNP